MVIHLVAIVIVLLLLLLLLIIVVIVFISNSSSTYLSWPNVVIRVSRWSYQSNYGNKEAFQLSNITCLKQVFFKGGEYFCKLW